MIACFDEGSGDTCMNPVTVGLVNCNDFLLWRLPYAPDCNEADCTVPSGLVYG